MVIKFNYVRPRYFEAEDRNVLPKGGDKMEVKTLREIPTTNSGEKTSKIWLQMFDCGYRVTTKNIDWSTWNGCVYSDIDSKHYYNECKPFNVDNLFKALYDYLFYNIHYNFYCLQQSSSKNSFHILFYFDVPKTEDNFKKCSQFVQDTMREAFYNIGAKEIFDWPHVNDTCTVSPVQGMYLTNNPIKYGNYEQHGFGAFEDIESYELRTRTNKYSGDIKADGTKLFEFKSYTQVTEPVGYKDHHQRGVLYRSLMGVFEEKDKVDAEWKKICELLPFGLSIVTFRWSILIC